MTTRQAFIEGGGDRWLERNRADLGKQDEVCEVLAATPFKPTNVLEIGCANGWRLKKLKELYQCEVFGIDPSQQALTEAKESGIRVAYGLADDLKLPDAFFDLVILGYFLVFTDPEYLFAIVAESDRVLADGGYLIIHDSMSPRPHKVRYEQLFSDENKTEPVKTTYMFRYDWPQLWLSHPAYRKLAEQFSPVTARAATMLKKNMAASFPLVITEDNP